MLNLLLILCLLILLALYLWLVRRSPQILAPLANADKAQRLLKPRTPNDCPACRAQNTETVPVSSACTAPIRPWAECKSRRGRPKIVATAGFACPNESC